MEKFVAVFAVLAALLAANVSVSEAQTEKYFKAGGDLRLSPQKVSGSIFSIVWKYDKNLLAEWVKDSIELTYYSKFKVRSKLDIVTGELVVHNMTSGDKGVYSVEINNQVQSLTYQTVEIQEVPKPTVELQPLVCHSTSGSCRLICHGDVANAGPVSYFWKKDDGEWEPSGDRKELSSEELDSVKTFTCRMENPVSQKDSDPFKNPLYQEKKPAESSSTGKIVGGVIGGLLLLALVIAGLVYWKRQKLPCLSSGSNLESPPNKPESKELLGVNEPNNTGKSSSSTSADKADNTDLEEVRAPNPADPSDGKGEGGGAPTS